MKQTDYAIQDLALKIQPNKILFFDMDGTLVDSNYANYLSYKKAIQSVMQSDPDIIYNHDQRFNRGILKNAVPNLSETEYKKITQEKERFYKDFLPETKLNKLVADILLIYSKTNKCFLVTNCRKDRALITLNYYGLNDKFNYIFYRQINDNEISINKYQNAITYLNISAVSVIVFENEKSEIDAAMLAGIPIQNILSI